MHASTPSIAKLSVLGIRDLRRIARELDIAPYRVIGTLSKAELIELMHPEQPLLPSPAPALPPSPPPPPAASTPPPDAPLRVYTYEQAAELLGVGHDWLREQVSKRAVPHARLGKYVRFTEDHLRTILDAATVQVAPPQPAPRSRIRSRL